MGRTGMAASASMPLPGSSHVRRRALSGWRSPSASQDVPQPAMSSPPGWRLRIADEGCYAPCCTALAEIDRQMGVTELMLWVLEDNHDAQRAYQALGFESTGERQYLASLWAVRAAAATRNQCDTTLLSQPDASLDCSTQPPNSARVQVFSCKEVHRIASTSHIVDTAGKPLPLLKIVLPGIDEAHAIVRRDHVIKMVLGRRKRNERGGEAAVVPISFRCDAEQGHGFRDHLCRASMNRDQYASWRRAVAHRTERSGRLHPSARTDPRPADHRTLLVERGQDWHTGHTQAAGLAHSTELAAAASRAKKNQSSL